MENDIFDMDHLHEERRKAIAASIRRTTVEELKTLGMELFPVADHPWHSAYFTFLRENGTATFYHATTHDRVHIIYCHDRNRGVWFIPNSGMGPLREKGLQTLKGVVEGQA